MGGLGLGVSGKERHLYRDGGNWRGTERKQAFITREAILSVGEQSV